MNENGHYRLHFEFGDYRVYPHERLLTKNGKRIALTPRVLDLLIVLIERDGELVSKDDLLQAIWAESFVEEGNLTRAISTLRKNLGVQSNGSDFIETVPKLGYRFIAPVRKLPAVQSEPPVVRPGRSRARYLAGAGVLLSGALVLVYLLKSSTNLVSPDGLTNLTNNIAEDNLPAWSPDGKKIAFTSNRDGAGDIYVMNADGSGVRRLTNTAAAESSSVWSPDGTKIAFDSERDGNREIYIMDNDGSNQTRLTFNPTVDAGPVSFSPDGKQIAFSRNASNDSDAMYNFDIWIMNIDGSDAKRLTTDPEFDAEPIWSPDGTRIFFTSGRDQNFKIYSISTDGTGEVRVSRENSFREGMFSFTPDGQQIFLSSNTPERVEVNQIFIMSVAGSNPRQISSFTDKVYRFVYSPAAGKFAVSSKKDGNFEIYTMDAAIPPGN